MLLFYDLRYYCFYSFFFQAVEVVEDHLVFSGHEGTSPVFKYAMEGTDFFSFN